jgi:hypothetical protein
MKSISYWVLGALVVLLIIGAPLFYIFCLNHVSLNHVGIAYNSADGSVSTQHPGWHRTSPFVRVMAPSVLPFVVKIPSKARLVNQRLVKFNPDGAVDFVKEQGFEWLNDQEFESVMLGYAYSGRQFPFIEILESTQSK